METLDDMSGAPANLISISVVVPVYRGGETLSQLAEELAEAAAAWEIKGLPLFLSEAIFVDDGAVDNSVEVLDELQERYTWLRILALPHNVGQHRATVAGLRESTGEWVATMDEDLQHRPTYLLDMLATAVRGEVDIVYAKPSNSVHESPFRDGSSQVIKLALAALTSNPRIRDFNSYRLIRGEVARATSVAMDQGNYLDVMLCAHALRTGTCVIPMKDRRYIKQKSSGWTPPTLVGHAWKLLVTSISRGPRQISPVTVDRSRDALLRAHLPD